MIQIQVELSAFFINRDYKYGISPKLVMKLHGMLFEHLLCAGENTHLSSLSGDDVVYNPPGANQVPVVLEGGEGETPNSRPSYIPSPGSYLVTNGCPVYALAPHLQDEKTIPKWTVPSCLGVYLDTTHLPPNCVAFEPDEASVLSSTASEGESGQDNVPISHLVPISLSPVPSIQAPEGDGACTLRPVWHPIPRPNINPLSGQGANSSCVSSWITMPSRIHLDVVLLYNLLHVGKYISPSLLPDSNEVTHLPPDYVLFDQIQALVQDSAPSEREMRQEIQVLASQASLEGETSQEVQVLASQAPRHFLSQVSPGSVRATQVPEGAQFQKKNLYHVMNFSALE